MPYQEIQALGFPNSPGKLGLYEKPWACISWYGPCTQLVNSKYSRIQLQKNEQNVIVILIFVFVNEKQLKKRNEGKDHHFRISLLLGIIY